MSMNPEKPLSSVCISAPLGSLIPTDRQDMNILRRSRDTVNDRQVGNGSQHNTGRLAPVRIGLVDSFALTRECLIETLTTPEHGFIVTAFETMSKLIASGVREIDIILYHDREQEGSRTLDASW